ncbi:hypothetical protein [Herbiconiux sp.]|uniref:hypothetical protein n=1 Tax=Herbiconiux sp. TaxID=1871186 RepID=UPI0025C4721B|nr:hypothetical protein [Herbiconiux sp.]
MTTDSQDHTSERALVEILDDSAPGTPMADALPGSILSTMVLDARAEMKRSRRRRATPRSVAIGTVLILTLGGAGAAAAATISGWEPWVQNPDAIVHFTLPSGASCEYRIVAKDTGDPADFTAARDYLKSTDVLALADIDGELVRVTARDVGQDDGSAVPATSVYSEDQLYYQGVTGAINNVLWDEMEARGIASPVTGSDLSFASQSDCAGVNW